MKLISLIVLIVICIRITRESKEPRESREPRKPRKLSANQRCKEGTYPTLMSDYFTRTNKCSPCTDILDVLVIIRTTEIWYQTQFIEEEKICYNYLLHIIAVANLSVIELKDHMQYVRRQQLLGSLDEYTFDIQWACREENSICGEGGILSECKTGYQGVYIPARGGEKTLIKCIQNCTYGLFTPTQGGCYPGCT